MKYIEDFEDGEIIIGHYLCRQKTLMKSKSGKSYLSLVLADKTGQIDGKVWELTNAIAPFESGDFIKVDGTVLIYNSDYQLKITRIRKSEEGEYTPADYVKSTDKDTELLYSQLCEFIDTIENPFVKALLENIFLSDEISAPLKTGTAARALHHGYLGGLIEHTLSVVQICDMMHGRYKYVNRDILIASAMLHDIGKIWELSPMPENEYTDAGQLLGHIVMGCELISREAAKIPNFPEKLVLMLKHCILAHHGEFEYGSPKLPHIIEAFILHLCDNFDAKVKAFEEYLEAGREDAIWLGFSKMLNRNVRKTDI